ncbi:MAG: flagellar protein FlgN [Burkholderiales bacterium]|nr:flagellar protein FlgN [Burkholderiales bacterium]
MTQHLHSFEALKDNLLTEVAAMRSFVEALKHEQQALVDNNADELIAITPQKNELLTSIVGMENQRNLSLVSLGFNADASGMQSLLTQNTHAALTEHWDTLLLVSAEAQELNRTNGLLISRQMSRNQGILNILQQDQGGAMYGADGQSKISSSTGRGIVAG